MIYDHVQATGAYDAAQDLSDLFNIFMHDDDFQDFVTRWDQSLSGTSELPDETVLEGLYRMKIAGFRTTTNCVGYVQSRIESR